MSYAIPNNSTNAGFAASVARRLNADGSRTAAIASMYRWCGVGVGLVAAGIAVGAAAYGISYITDSRTSLEKMSEAMADALNKVTLKVDQVTGVVTLDPNTKVPLDANGATVRLDTSGSTVRLDPNGANVKLDPSNFPRPSPQQLQPPSSQPPRSDSHVVTDYTVFKHVKMGEGEIVTGWKFRSSEDTTPYGQYCYFMASADADTSAIFNVARNGTAGAAPKGLPIKFQDAINACEWFNGTATQASPEQFAPQNKL